jgi:hypothetical protein
MVRPQLEQFYYNWLGKADTYSENTLADQFDKFISLYVVFNALYIEVIDALKQSGEALPKDYKDKKAATDYIAQFLKSKFYIQTLLSDELSRDNLDKIIDIIEHNRFHIILELGVPLRNYDLELLSFLRSKSSQEKAKAILSMLYHIRCNIFHGQKGFEEEQRELLEPATHLLRRTVEITFEKLNSI